MTRHIGNYTRTHRREWGLTQDELAFLLGCASTAQVSRYEHSKREPSLRAALGYHVVFGVTPIDLLPGIYEAVEELAIQRAYQLYQKLDGKTDKTSARKRQLVTDMVARATDNSNRLAV